MKENKTYKYRDILIVGLIFITYIFFLINLPNIWSSVKDFSNLFTPFIVGFAIAYLINPLVLWIRKLFFKCFKKNCPNAVGMIFAYLIVVLLITFLCMTILPQIWMSLKVIINEIPKSIEQIYSWVDTEGNQFLSELTNNKYSVQDISDMVLENITPVLSNMKGGVETVFNTTSAVLTFVLNFVLSILISIYMLMHKDIYKGQMRKAFFAFFKEEKAVELLEFWNSVNITFSRFLNARIIDSTIIGIICYIGCLILGFDNSLLIAFIVGVTNIIPYFGPFIGAIPCALIVLLQSPMDMLIFCLFILVLQQFDGNILGPKLLGDSLGLTSFWIIFSVAIMTGIFGILGMVIGVPLFAIIYMLVKDFINDKLEKKGKSTNTEDYIIDSSKTNVNQIGKEEE